MCGIAGFFGQGNEKNLREMTQILRHRGPDDEGFYYDGKVGLGHKRLSIIDVSAAGRQPMASEDGSVIITYNGEIYNYQDLKKELKQPHRFRGHSDTEVILYLYQEIGEAMFSKLNGMFALAIYDKRKNKVVLARDRMGKKPLYWCTPGCTLIFGSEMKAILQHPEFKKELDLSALNKYLQFEYVPTPNTIFKNVYKLEPGTYLVYKDNKITKKKFWQPEFKETNIGYEEAKIKLDKLFQQAVKDRLVSDVPLGVLLSGGIDSSTIAYYAQKASSQRIKTFSIGFKEKSFDESSYARLVAEHLGTDHHEEILSAQDMLDLVPRIADILDEPLADASIVPTELLSRFTRQHVTVALGGDGGDELLAGYDTFVAERGAEIYGKLPRAVRQGLIEKIVRMLPTSFSNISLDFAAKSFIKHFYEDKKHRQFMWLGSFDKTERSQLFSPDVWQELEKENEFSEIDKYWLDIGDTDYYNKLIFLYLRTYLLDDILVKVDRASMFNSLEVRAPFLDVNVVNFLNSLPLEYKLKGLKTKRILKDLMADRLPESIINRKKKGFGIPLAEWLAGELKPLVLDYLSEDRIKKQGLFNYQYINKLLNDHFSKRCDNRKLIWTLLVFEMWQEKWLK